jgi:hypothetical protein
MRMCRGCSKPKDQCDCPKDSREAGRRYAKLIHQLQETWQRADRAVRRRSRFHVVQGDKQET